MISLIKEPIKREISLLVVIFLVAFSSVIVAKRIMSRLARNHETAVSNQRARRNLGKVILQRLLAIELDFKNLATMDDIRDLAVYKKRTVASVNDIEQALDVLRRGGQYKNVMPANFNNVDQITEQISFLVGKDEGYVIEVIDLTPKILDIRHVAVELVAAVKMKFSDSDETDLAAHEAGIFLLLKRGYSYLQRSRESADKIFYDTNLEIQRLEKKQARMARLGATIRYGVIAITMILVAVTFVRTIRRVGQIIKERRLAEQEIRSLNNGLEQRVADRTRELTTARQAALNMMEDAEEARKKTSAANESLRKEIADRKQAEQALRESEESSRTILECIPAGVVVIDVERHRIMEVNPVAIELTGRSREELIGKKCFEFICPRKDGQCPITDFGETIRQQESFLLNANKTEVPVLKTVVPVKLNNRECLLEFFTDLSARKALETQLVHAQKLEAIGQLAAGIAHEINTPTQYVGDNTRFLKECFEDVFRLNEKYQNILDAAENGPLPPELIAEIKAAAQKADIEYLAEEIPKAIEQSLEGIERVTSIVRAMKEFSHPNAKEKTPVDLNKEIENTITVCRNEWKYVADVVTDFAPDLPLVSCLPGDLNQVFLNMIVNAAHAIADVAGNAAAEKGTITINTCRNNGSVEVRISDTGTGIPENLRQRVFDPFFTTKEVGKGTGQGLAIAHSVVTDKHGGTISIESETGKGTTFIISLPVGGNSE